MTDFYRDPPVSRTQIEREVRDDFLCGNLSIEAYLLEYVADHPIDATRIAVWWLYQDEGYPEDRTAPKDFRAGCEWVIQQEVERRCITAGVE